jgi:tetratricopeptide (TPR) repeat protein
VNETENDPATAARNQEKTIMKNLLLTFIGTCLIGGLAFYACQKYQRPQNVRTSVSSTMGSPQEQAQSASPLASPEATQEVPTKVEVTVASTAAPEIDTSSVVAKSSSPLPFQQMMQTLISPQTSFEQKQAAWQQLKDSGKMDLAISDLEQRAASNPNSAEYPATLGQAYLQKAGMLKDIREQGILGMKADQSFDAALNLDSANWDAAFWKATAMSYWPPQLGKGQEVVERFAELIKQQETQPVQPQFAQTYVLLGDQYQKQGYADYAKQIWQRGAGFFPNNPQLQEKLAQVQPQQAATQ